MIKWNPARIARWTFVCALSALLAVEFVFRSIGLGNFPVYDADVQIGYIPRPNQRGVFFGGYDWYLNDRSMLSDEQYSVDKRDGVLIIGDSIVWGGVGYRQCEKLGPNLQRLSRNCRVWSVGAGSWAIPNEIEWLKRNRDVLRGVDVVFWVINSEDFKAASQWSNDLTHPKEKPKFLTLYLLRKYLSKFGGSGHGSVVSELAPVSPAEVELRRFCGGIAKSFADLSVVFVFYPNRTELAGNKASADYSAFRLASIAAEFDWVFVDLRNHAAWSNSFYRDEIHPSVFGYQQLASILDECLTAAHF